MPWKELSVVNQRMEFVLKALAGGADLVELCREYGISRKTGYKWKKRFLEQGPGGLEDQSRRPKCSPREVSEDVICKAVKLKIAHPNWGPKKIRAVFARTYPELELACESTFKRILDKAGLVRPRKRRKQAETGRLSNRVQAERPNHVWTVDFKGWWRTGDRCRFEPLTIRDDYSRYVLCAQALESSGTIAVREAFERVFCRYGMPGVIRSDNGSPFASSRAPFGLSQLSAWWVALGIDLDRITPGRPDQNGAHERMHRDIAKELEAESKEDMAKQQAALDVWRNTYNHERPHEAIEMKVPADLFQKSERVFEPEIELEYPPDHLCRKVNCRGIIALHKNYIRISEALANWHVGLKYYQKNQYDLWFSRLCLGRVDLEMHKFCPALPENED